MRILFLVTLSLLVCIGCRRPRTSAGDESTSPQKPSTDQPAVHAPSGVVVGGGGGGGSGGAAQAVRKAAIRTVNLNEMQNIRTFIDSASAASGRMPSAQEIAEVLRTEAPSTYQLVKEGAIVLTGTRSRDAIWAYTAEPQSVGGEHLVLTVQGPERIAAATLNQRLKQQGQ